MGIRRYAPLLLAMVVATACGEQEQTESVTGLQFAKPQPPAAVCDANSLNSLISGYFPGSSSNPIKTLKDAMVAATGTANRDAGFAILDSIGSLSRNSAVATDPSAGSLLTQGIIKCMDLDAADFDPTFPTDPIYNFTKALTQATGGAFYVRGGDAGGTATVVGALIEPGPDTTVLSGVAPTAEEPSWTNILDGNTGSDGRVLLYGYPVTLDPLVYEWATIPPAADFTPGAIVAVCDDNTASDVMVFETNIGILQYSSGNAICAEPISLVLREGGWGPRALVARLARALTPSPLQAAVVTLSGSGGTIRTVKSKFSTEPVETVKLEFVQEPPRNMKLGQAYPVIVRATTVVKGKVEGVDGGCVYLVGSTNNGQGTELDGTRDPSCQTLAKAAFDKTETEEIDGVQAAGYAVFQLKATKTGGLTITATATDDEGNLVGVLGRDGQTFLPDTVRTNVKP
jgi:hypothetical protein